MRYLLIRPDDHLIAGCDIIGCVLAPAPDPGAAPVTISAPTVSPPGGSRLVVTFPPQHVAEELQDASASAAPPSGVWQTALAGPSRVAVALPPGASIPFTVSGLLTAAGVPVWRAAAGFTVARGVVGSPIAMPLTPSAAHPQRLRVREIQQHGPSAGANPADAGELTQRSAFIDVVNLPESWTSSSP